MADSVAKIKSVDVSELTETAKNKRAELAVVAEFVVGGQTYTRNIRIVADDVYIHHIGGPVTQQEIERLVLSEVDKLESLHAVAAQLESRKNLDLVAEMKR